MTLFTDTIESPVGHVGFAVNQDGALVRVHFLGKRTFDVFRAELEAAGVEVAPAARACARVRRQLEQYFARRRRAFDLELAPGGTAFQRAVWEALTTIPYGTTVSYGELARRVGAADASRAVGHANNKNPIPIVVPCHRVVGADGRLVGFAAGLAIKQALLDFERGQTSFEGPF